MEPVIQQPVEVDDGAVEIPTPDGVIFIPTYVPTVEETIKASGGHRQGTLLS